MLKNRRDGIVSRALAPNMESKGFESPIESSQRLKSLHLLLPWLAFTAQNMAWLA